MLYYANFLKKPPFKVKKNINREGKPVNYQSRVGEYFCAKTSVKSGKVLIV